MKFSIVIVAKDAAGKIGRLLESLRDISDDIIVCDTGSKDDTIAIAVKMGAKVHQTEWKGYGISKNEANAFARYDWILSLDSDEKVDQELYEQLKQWEPVNNTTVYQVVWKNFFGNQWIKYSNWGGTRKNRLFYKHLAHWDDAIAHEDITANVPLSYIKLKGYLEHYSFSDSREYASKMVHSAMITAEKYHRQGKRSSVIMVLFSSLFSFLKTYFFKLGFLDGRKGGLIAVTTAYYTFMKYTRLYELNKKR